MPNVTWQEPQILIDLLALNLFAEKNGLHLSGSQEIAIVSPWLSDVEIAMRPGPWYQQLTVGDFEGPATLSNCVQAFLQDNWKVLIAILVYGRSPSGLFKDPAKYQTERQLLQNMIQLGAKVYLIPDLHAKGIITPLAIITGSTNLTHSGLYAQSQNTNYFPYNHSDYNSNLIQLKSYFDDIYLAKKIS